MAWTSRRSCRLPRLGALASRRSGAADARSVALTRLSDRLVRRLSRSCSSRSDLSRRSARVRLSASRGCALRASAARRGGPSSSLGCSVVGCSSATTHPGRSRSVGRYGHGGVRDRPAHRGGLGRRPGRATWPGLGHPEHGPADRPASASPPRTGSLRLGSQSPRLPLERRSKQSPVNSAVRHSWSRRRSAYGRHRRPSEAGADRRHPLVGPDGRRLPGGGLAASFAAARGPRQNPAPPRPRRPPRRPRSTLSGG